MKKLKAAVVGLGVGEQHILGYQESPNCEVTSICDIDKKKLSEVHGRFPHLKTYNTFDELMSSDTFDVLSICTYDQYHCDQIATALRAKKHVFVEKPVCIHPEELEKIEKAKNSSPFCQISANLVLRRSPRFVEIKELVEADTFGNLFYVEGDYNYGRIHKLLDGWRGQEPTYSVVLGGGIHLIDLILWLVGDPPVEVFAYGNSISTRGSSFRGVDLVTALIRFKSGLVAKVSCNFACVHPHFHPFSLYGTQASFVQNVHGNGVLTSRDPDVKSRALSSNYPGVRKGVLLKGFVDSIVQGHKPEVSWEEISLSHRVAFAIEESLTKGNPVPIAQKLSQRSTKGASQRHF